MAYDTGPSILPSLVVGVDIPTNLVLNSQFQLTFFVHTTGGGVCLPLGLFRLITVIFLPTNHRGNLVK